jgi:hypothetical protein
MQNFNYLNKMENKTMKREKLFLPVLIALLISVTSAASAQFRFGIKGGYNLATVKFNKDVLRSENVDGFHVGPLIEFIPDAGVGFDFAILYSRKGFFLENANEGITNDYLEIPVNLKMKIGIPVISPYFAAGPYVAFRVDGDKLWDIVDVNNVKSQIEAKSFAAGLNFTAGVELVNRIQVGLTYNWGLTDNYSSRNGDLSDFRGKPHTWMISATLMF